MDKSVGLDAMIHQSSIGTMNSRPCSSRIATAPLPGLATIERGTSDQSRAQAATIRPVSARWPVDRTPYKRSSTTASDSS
ncbi:MULTISPECIES: hypothetical protein [unclassified Curtobacterium]|uniref:hypothetical protein n=1 Tax=unclassified Curtobacterium TaxID=257496 RepID=UPI0011138078|nr:MULTISPECIES: hypothetical protein [unclassified Curtobacterium]MCT9621521.1 hypothetical protein [Curtobacterium sp. C2H10]